MNQVIKTPDEILSALPKPQLENIDSITLTAEDWLVVCGGFEDRAVAVLHSAILGAERFSVILINYEPFVPENKSKVIREICRTGNINLVEVSYNREVPSGFGETLLNAVPTIKGRLFLDISGMSRLLIVQAIVALKERPEASSNCWVIYTEAQTYPPNEDEASFQLARSDSDPSSAIFFLSSGVYGVTLVPELSSHVSSAVQTRLVVFPSLDSHQLVALRAELQPSRLSLIEGVPPVSHNKWRQTVISEVNRLDDAKNAERYSVSTLAYEETVGCLLEIYARHALYERILVSPTGSKMQAVAVGIVRSFLDDLQIVYPTPRDFLKPEKYTEGVGQMHLLPLQGFLIALRSF